MPILRAVSNANLDILSDNLVYLKPDDAGKTSCQTDQQINWLQSAKKKKVTEHWNIEHQAQSEQRTSENPQKRRIAIAKSANDGLRPGPVSQDQR
jgi:TfoX/Sxy family transcriptional regulator of competence genes